MFELTGFCDGLNMVVGGEREEELMSIPWDLAWTTAGTFNETEYCREALDGTKELS